MCAVLKVFWVLVVTLSLVSCSVSPRKRNTKYSSFLLDFAIHFCTCSQTVFCDRQFFSVSKLLHTFPSRQFDVFVSRHFIATPCHRFFPISATFHITRKTHQSTQTSHNQCLHAWLIVFFDLSGHNDTSTFHVINPALVKSPAHALDSTKLSQFPNAQKPERWLCVNPFKNTTLHTRWAEIVRTPFYRQFGITKQALLRMNWLWRSCATCWPLNNHDSPAKYQHDQYKEDFFDIGPNSVPITYNSCEWAGLKPLSARKNKCI